MTSTHLTNLIDFRTALTDDCTNHIIRNEYLLRHLTSRSDNSSLNPMSTGWTTNHRPWNLCWTLLEDLSCLALLGLRCRLWCKGNLGIYSEWILRCHHSCFNDAGKVVILWCTETAVDGERNVPHHRWFCAVLNGCVVFVTILEVL